MPDTYSNQKQLPTSILISVCTVTVLCSLNQYLNYYEKYFI